jgi:hypothetical protein
MEDPVIIAAVEEEGRIGDILEREGPQVKMFPVHDPPFSPPCSF